MTGIVPSSPSRLGRTAGSQIANLFVILEPKTTFPTKFMVRGTTWEKPRISELRAAAFWI